MAGKVSEAIEMCLQYNVKLTESLADQLTGTNTSSHLLIQLAEAAQRQGDYQLAAKKFTQAGDKVITNQVLTVRMMLIFMQTSVTSHESPVEIRRHRQDCLLCKRFTPEGNIHFGWKLSSNARLASSP
jgi:hypothetical protein